jgi:hypothetical protein
VSVHTLASAGSEIAEHLTSLVGQTPFSAHALASIPNLKIGELLRVRRQFYNAFKHATTLDSEVRDDRALLYRFEDEQNNHLLFIGWHDYWNGIGKTPIEAQVFQVWYFALYQDKLNPEHDPRPFLEMFPDLTTQSPAMRKETLRRQIATSFTDLKLRSHPGTDPRPLILPAAYL